MRPRKTVDEWRTAIFRARVSDSTKVYLLKLADHMRTDRTVSVPRATVARELGRSERRITERTKEAHEAGLLDTVVHGRKHVTAVYVGLFPNALSGTKSSPLRTTGNRPPESGLSGTHGGPTSSKRSPELSPDGWVPNERRSEEAAPTEQSAQVRADVDHLESKRRSEKRTA